MGARSSICFASGCCTLLDAPEHESCGRARLLGACQGHHLASPVHHVQSGIYSAPPLRLALSLCAPGGGPQCAVSDAWRTEFGALCRDLSYLTDGALSPGLRPRLPEFGSGVDTMWSAAAQVFPGDEKHSRC